MSRVHHSANVYSVLCPCIDCDFGVKGEKKAVMRRIDLHMKLSHPEVKNDMAWVDKHTGGFKQVKNSESIKITINNAKYNEDVLLKIKEGLIKEMRKIE